MGVHQFTLRRTGMYSMETFMQAYELMDLQHKHVFCEGQNYLEAWMILFTLANPRDVVGRRPGRTLCWLSDTHGCYHVGLSDSSLLVIICCILQHWLTAHEESEAGSLG